MKNLLAVSLVLWLAVEVRGQALRCPKVSPYTVTCSPRIEHFCSSDDECSRGRRCCPSSGDGGCTLWCRRAEVLKGCPKPVDLALLIDASGSISIRNFIKFKQFLERLVDEFDISETGTHVGLIEYSTKASVQLKFNDFSKAQLNAVNVKRKIQGLPHTRGFTYIDKALALADSEIFSERNGMRPGVSKMAIVMTDGAQTIPDDENRTSIEILRKAVQPIKNKGVEVITLGIGKSTILEDLVEIASDDTGVFLAEDFTALDEIVTDVKEGKCPIDGKWAAWGQFSVCSKTCGGGISTRKRSCTDPPPENGGLNCPGPSEEQEACNEHPCPIDGNWSDWEDWGICTVTCGGGEQVRTRSCTDPPPEFGGQPCPGDSEESRSCGEEPCPVDGNWSDWDDWSDCPVSCGGSEQTRTRTCTNPPAAFGGKPCPGDSEETRICNDQPCPIDGNWADWNPWSDCPVTCGGGVQNRSRTCTNPPAKFGGEPCPGPSDETRACNENPCPVDGNWADWNDWSDCPVTCGGGVQNRSRTCTNPPAQFGGDECPGESEETRACNEDPCPIDGNWSGWDDWSDCPVTCGGSEQTRTRTCTNPPAAFGGKPCPGDSEETRICNDNPCPIDGNWADWNDWSDCPVTCGGGVQNRSRTCTNPPPQFGGESCPGPGDETRACNENPCPVDGNWADWNDWSDCPVTCGGGVQNRSRTCTNPPAKFGGEECPGESEETRACNEDPCPIDGNWSGWDDWSDCPVTCGGSEQTRTRTCTNPPAAFGGKPCPGDSEETRICNDNPCPIDGNWADWNDWSDCPVTCGGGVQNRSRTCTNPPPQFGGESCPGPGDETRACNENPCPVDGNWADWNDWSDCPVTCGGGVQNRSRTCTNPPPQFGGEECPGESEETRPCNEDPCPIDGNWSGWDDWSDCPVTCGGSEQTRTRTCTNPPAAFGGKPCPGDSEETRICNDQPCPIDGNWADWNDWSDCPVTCGGGVQNRSRTCTNPLPQFGGESCPGSSDDTRPCNENPCPGHGSWAGWLPWSACPVTCGGGIQNRSRTCTDPPPTFGGEECPGESEETRPCNEDPCPIDGNWSDWDDWSDCPVSCGGSEQTRTRTCTNPPAAFGGKPCPGDIEETRICNDNPCPIDGNWADWNDWSDCPVTCGGGVQNRSRTCTNPPTAFGGESCPGESDETRQCNEVPCPIDGSWSDWGPWSECTVTCGGGTQVHTRSCNNPPPAFNGLVCIGDSEESRECNNKACGRPAVIVHINTSESVTLVGEKVELKCVSDGDPTPNVTWYAPDGSELVTITTIDNTIFVDMDSEEDFGEYRCMADNSLGPPVERIIEVKPAIPPKIVVGPPGDPGPKGMKGDKGAPGPPGPEGERGVKGQLGNTGPKGQPGPPGPPGPPGKMILNLTGGPDSGVLSGVITSGGSKGPNIGFIEMRGAPGDPGPSGRMGAPGFRGPDGETGQKGDMGLPGDTGKPGKPGLQGPPGVSGRDGEDGAPGPNGEPGEAGPIGEQGPDGVTGARGLPGIKGDMGEQGNRGDPGDRGKDGKRGSPGQPGRNGLDGNKGRQGPTGTSGRPGPPGPTGRDGRTGKEGPEGPAGVPGETGEPGPPGKAGPNGDQGPQGLRGPRGKNGEIGPTGPPGKKGDTGQPGNPGEPGLPGLKGAMGAVGNPGVQGDRGSKGAAGVDGRPGDVGRRGERGHPGKPGPRGRTGSKGSQGRRGPIGLPGPSGPRGRKGSRGRRGSRGLPGDEGPQGPQGEGGFPGAAGLTGQKGHDGKPGSDGIPGEQGDQGPPGEAGETGRQGIRGLRGLPGKAGKAGIEGPKGFAGDDGSPGRAGDAGIPGPPGRPGLQGATGMKGADGRAGAPGNTGPRGPKGDRGQKGPAGHPGRIGRKGFQGERGPMGFPGSQGLAGPPGAQGPSGFAGRSGRRGRTGERGKDGKPGLVGERGPTGTVGLPGPPGPPGRYGQPGANGEDGQSGPPGARGSHGPSGRPGFRGFTGLPGRRGKPGLKGEKGGVGYTGMPGRNGKDGTPGEDGRPGANGQRGLRGPKGKDGFNGQPGRAGKRGIVGLPGSPGTPGIPGSTGPTGPVGPRGPDGLKGSPGPKGHRGESGNLGDKGEAGGLGSAGAAGEIGDMGRPGYPGVRGPPGMPGRTGAPGRPGPEGEPGVEGRPGIPATKGARGLNGPPGKPGPPGRPGLGGLNGEPGRQGKDGPPGHPGLPGFPGPKGHFGKSGYPGFNAPPGVQGPDGEIGDQGPDGELGKPGEPGHQGFPGEVGKEGAQGPKGKSGVPGKDGDSGSNGQPGMTGDNGETGLQGRPGLIGERGLDGEPGEKGEAGMQGDTGESGADGSPGERGQSGPNGIKGMAGEEGETGTSGQKGDTGYMGTQGPLGPPGEEGTKGEPGGDGSTGPPGPKGVTGPQGPPGEQGNSGPEGRMGPEGDPGRTGERGRRGADGLSGTPGPPGPPGDQGIPGKVKILNPGWIHGSQNKGPGFRLYSSTKEEEPELPNETMNYLRGLSNVIYFYKTQHGTINSPARSCRELHLEHPDSPSGKYWIDPNEGCVSDAEQVYCDFERGTTCVFPENKQVNISNAQPFQWMSERITDTPPVNYNMDQMQMRFLRLLSRSVSQNITYHCYNSRAWDDDGHTIKLQGDDEMELTASEKTKPVVVKNGCEVSDNKWHQTVLEFNTTKMEALPVFDVAPYDIASSEMKQEFFLEIGPVCFFY